MPVQVSFGDTVFPINPQTLTRTHQRALSRKNLLGGKQILDSRYIGLPTVTMEGTLVGDNAKATMDALEAKFFAARPLTLVTPTVPSGESALLVELSFNVDKIAYYEKLIHFTATFKIAPSTNVKYPKWRLQVENANGVYEEITDVLELYYTRVLGAQASEFELLLDNSRGQYAYPYFDYGRNVKIWMGFDTLTTEPQFWGLIDGVEYEVDKGKGSTVRVFGRNYGQRLAEGTNMYLDQMPIFPDQLITMLLNGFTGYWEANVTPQYATPTGVKFRNLGGVNWNYFAYPFQMRQTFNDKTILEVIEQINEIYKMQCYIDSGENEGTPALVWFDKPRLTGLLEDAVAGSNTIKVENPQLYCHPSWLGKNIGESSLNTVYICDVNADFQTLCIWDANVATGTLTLKPGQTLNRTYRVADAAFITTTSWKTTPFTYTWGQNIIQFNTRVDGVPMRNRVNVYGGAGIAVYADSEQPTINYCSGAHIVNITDPTGSGAKASATVANGSVTSITVIDGGSGYSNNPTIYVSDPVGNITPCQAQATVVNGVITGITVIDGGSGYVQSQATNYPNPGYFTGDPYNGTYSLQQRYGMKRLNVDNSALNDEWAAAVYAYTQLLKLELPQVELILQVEGNPLHRPGAYLVYNNLPMIGGFHGYLITECRERMSIDSGFTAELVCRRTIQTMTADLLSGVLKKDTQDAMGQSTLVQGASQPVEGTVVGRVE